MFRQFAGAARWICLGAAATFVAPSLVAAKGDVLQSVLQPVFRQSCVKCHGEGGNLFGNVDLSRLHSAADLTK
ncbi:MAG: hypothetical protein F4X77_04845, partial [Acidobacteriia bacterium]|nr:hypothetical protein [Terriglobia bacterium]